MNENATKLLASTVLGGLGFFVLATCANDAPSVNTSATPHVTSTHSIEAVYSFVAGSPTGRPLRPLFEDQPEDRAAIARLSRAIKGALSITLIEDLVADDQGRFLRVHHRDGTATRIRRVIRCEPLSEADARKSGEDVCFGEWTGLPYTWWVESRGFVKSSDMRLWWDNMGELMVPTGNVGIPETIRPGESFPITVRDWDMVVNGDSIHLSLESQEGAEIDLGEFPLAFLIHRGQGTVPESTPSGRYWLRVEGAGFSEIIKRVQVE